MGEPRSTMASCSEGIPSACIYSSVAAVGAVAACAALSTKLSSNPVIPSRYTGALWGGATGIGSGGLMLYLRGRRHVIPCHWPCYAGFVPPAMLAWWAIDRAEGDDAEVVASSGRAVFMAQFVAAMLSGLTAVFYVSPQEGRK